MFPNENNCFARLVAWSHVARAPRSSGRREGTGLCQQRGAAYGNINNTPECSIEAADAFAEIYATVLDAGQKKRIEQRQFPMLGRMKRMK